MKLFAACFFLCASLLSSGLVLAQATPFVTMVPARLLDTRAGSVTADGQFAGSGPMASATVLNLTVLGRAGIPTAGVDALALNVTVVNPTAPGYLVAFPAGTPQPPTANINLVPGQSISNQVLAKPGANGQISLFLSAGVAGSAHIVVDVSGYFPTGAGYTSLTPARLLDTRTGMKTVDSLFAGGGAVTAGATLNLSVLGRGGVPISGVRAVAVNVTAVTPTAASFITAFPAGSTRPFASNLNTTPGQTISNLVIVGVGDSGYVSLFNNLGNTDMVADIVGYFPSDFTFTAITPARLLDTRTGAATIDQQFSGAGPIASGATLNLTVAGRGGVPATGVGAIALNIAAAFSTASGHLTAWGAGTTSGGVAPNAMEVNFSTGAIDSSLVIAPVGANGQVSLFNSNGSTQVIADVVGWFATAGSPNNPATVTPCAASSTRTYCLVAAAGPSDGAEYQELSQNGVMHGDPGTHAIRVYFIFYGPWRVDYTQTGGLYQDPQIGILQAFIGSVGNTAWLNTVKNYYDANPVYPNASSNIVYGGSVFDGAAGNGSNGGSQGNDLNEISAGSSSMLAILTRALTTSANYGGMLPTSDKALYVIVGHSSVTDHLFGFTIGANADPDNSHFECAYHQGTKYMFFHGKASGKAEDPTTQALVNGSNIHFIYIGDPASDPPRCEHQYWAQGLPSPNGNVSGDAAVNLLSHELVESISDPNSYGLGGYSSIYPYLVSSYGGWATRVSQYPGGAEEIADLCQSSNNYTNFENVSYLPSGAPYNVTAANGMHFMIQSYGRAFDGVCTMGNNPAGSSSF